MAAEVTRWWSVRPFLAQPLPPIPALSVRGPPNDADHQPGARELYLLTAALSPGSVHPLVGSCWTVDSFSGRRVSWTKCDQGPRCGIVNDIRRPAANSVNPFSIFRRLRNSPLNCSGQICWSHNASIVCILPKFFEKVSTGSLLPTARGQSIQELRAGYCGQAAILNETCELNLLYVHA